MQDRLKRIFNIAGRTILITGASGYFGGYMAKTFLEVGAKVILLGRSKKLLTQIETCRREFGEDSACGFQADFYKRSEFVSLLRKMAKTFEIDVLINNAYDFSKKTGFNTPKGRLENLTYDQWRSAFDGGIYWPALTTQIIGAQFKRKKKGIIINMGSMYGVVSPDPKLYKGMKFFNPPTYTVNKAAIIALTRYTASFWGQHGIRCNAILPGPFPNVESNGPNSVTSNKFFLDRLKDNTVIGRVGHPNDLMGILIYLACDASSFMTGQAIIIDGGWTIR